MHCGKCTQKRQRYFNKKNDQTLFSQYKEVGGKNKQTIFFFADNKIEINGSTLYL